MISSGTLCFYLICASIGISETKPICHRHFASSFKNNKPYYLKASAFVSGVLGQRRQSSRSFSAEQAISAGGCHRAWLSPFHTLFTAHYYLSISCNYPSWWLMECFRGWVGKQLGLSCWGLYIITQSLNTALCEDNLRRATFVPPGCGSSLLSSCCVAPKKVTLGCLCSGWFVIEPKLISTAAILLWGSCFVRPVLQTNLIWWHEDAGCNFHDHFGLDLWII